MYDFHKIRTKAKEKEFKHEYFKKSKPELLGFIRRKLGEEGNFSTSKSDVLLQKCRELEERCQTFESMAKLSIPVKKLKVLEQEDCKLLFDGLMAYLDCDIVDERLAYHSYQGIHEAGRRGVGAQEDPADVPDAGRFGQAAAAQRSPVTGARGVGGDADVERVAEASVPDAEGRRPVHL